MKNEKEELIFKKHLTEAAWLAYDKGIVVYTDFLGLAEQDMFLQSRGEFPPVQYSCYGGVDSAERFCLRFDGTAASAALKDAGLSAEMKAEYPIACLKISPSSSRFCEALTHRDYLGALLHLGIVRSKLGDIYQKDGSAYVFCTETIADFLCRELCTVKHTDVHCETVLPEQEGLAPTLQEITSTVPSLRLDALAAAAFQTSRSRITEEIDGGRVFINGRAITKAGTQIEEGDMISVRGKGRFYLDEIKNTTKKGRIAVTIQKFV